MIYQIKIELDLKQVDVIHLLKSRDVIFKNKLPFGKSFVYTASWENLENPDNFRLNPNTHGMYNVAWRSHCSIKPSKDKSKTILSIKIFPPLYAYIPVGIVFSGIIYSIIQFGIYNYGTIGFLPSIIVPSFLLSLMILFWVFIAKINAKKFKKDIVASLISKQE